MESCAALLHSEIESVTLRPGGRGYLLALRGWLFMPADNIAALRFGVAQSPLVTARRSQRKDIATEWPQHAAALYSGFSVEIPCRKKAGEKQMVECLITLPDGYTVVARFEVSPQCEEPSPPAQTSAEKLLIVSRAEFFDGDGPRLGALLQAAKRLQIQAALLSELPLRSRRHALLDLPLVSGLAPAELPGLISQQYSGAEWLWVTEPGHVRMLSGAASHAAIVFEPRLRRVRALDLLGAAVIEGDTGHWAEKEIVVQVGANGLVPLAKEQLVDCCRRAAAVVAGSEETRSVLEQLGLARLISVDLSRQDDAAASLTLSAFLSAGTKRLIRQPGRAPGKSIGRDSTACDAAAAHDLSDLLAAAGRRGGPPKRTDPVDVVIPIYNAADSFKRCLESVLDHADSPFNLFLVNDGSTQSEVKEYLAGRPWAGRSACLGKTSVIQHARNRGFTASVNEALALSSGDIVLLNSDTVVPPQWLSRLMAPLDAHPRAATVTPFTSDTTVGSLNFAGYKSEDLSAAERELPAVVQSCGASEPLELPTGIGFCLAMRRQAFESVGFFDEQLFGPMYGEENDWCCRAARQGYQHLLARDLFVGHEHGASAGTLEYSRQQRLDEHCAIVERLHPGYHAGISAFLQRDPGKSVRELICMLAARRADARAGVLLVNNPELSGGSQIFQRGLLAQLAKRARVYVLEMEAQQAWIADCSLTPPLRCAFRLDNFTPQKLAQVLDTLAVRSVFVNQLVGTQFLALMPALAESGRPIHYFVHDYFCACPSLTLLNRGDAFCGGEKDAAKCGVCLDGFSADSTDQTIRIWRERFGDFLSKVSHIWAPSAAAAEIVSGYYPDVKIKPLVYPVSPSIKYSYDLGFADDPVLTLGVIGSIGPHKGEEYLYGLQNLIKKLRLPARIVVIGTTNRHMEPYISPDGVLEVTGAYQPEEISALLSARRAALVLALSIWPEPYCFAVTEALWSGYPVLSFPLGAGAERVAAMQGGWVLPSISLPRLCDKVVVLTGLRRLIKQQAQALRASIEAHGRERRLAAAGLEALVQALVEGDARRAHTETNSTTVQSCNSEP